eukprot:XP_001707362.1 Hypothetical protein GL50803_31866 [Giardia lamblia ATCC 50803]
MTWLKTVREKSCAKHCPRSLSASISQGRDTFDVVASLRALCRCCSVSRGVRSAYISKSLGLSTVCVARSSALDSSSIVSPWPVPQRIVTQSVLASLLSMTRSYPNMLKVRGMA